MKLISLNTWCGRLKEELISFLKVNSNIDIFLLQEVYSEAEGKHNIFESVFKYIPDYKLNRNLKKELDLYDGFFSPHLFDYWGLATFYKKEIKILNFGDVFVHKFIGYNPDLEKLGHMAKNVQYIKFLEKGKLVTIINFHGLWNGEGKDDTEDRIKQIENIIQFLKSLKNENSEIILCGDFNLLPNTKSIKLLEDFGLINLIKVYDIKSTRTSFYTKEEKFADYIFVSGGIKVNSFEILQEEVSDHFPLFLDFDVI